MLSNEEPREYQETVLKMKSGVTFAIICSVNDGAQSHVAKLGAAW